MTDPVTGALTNGCGKVALTLAKRLYDAVNGARS